MSFLVTTSTYERTVSANDLHIRVLLGAPDVIVLDFGNVSKKALFKREVRSDVTTLFIPKGDLLSVESVA